MEVVENEICLTFDTPPRHNSRTRTSFLDEGGFGSKRRVSLRPATVVKIGYGCHGQVFKFHCSRFLLCLLLKTVVYAPHLSDSYLGIVCWLKLDYDYFVFLSKETYFTLALL